MLACKNWFIVMLELSFPFFENKLFPVKVYNWWKQTFNCFDPGPVWGK